MYLNFILVLEKMADHYYGIAIPPDIENLDPNRLELKTFYSDKAEVMKVLKEIKTARFKVFRNKEEAIQFSGSHVVPSNVTVSDSILLSSPKPSEKSEFKSLKPQEEVKFRKAIEANPSDLEFLVSCIEDNARYLVTPSDTPTILQQGQRHNALHVAARHGKADAARLVLAQVTGNLMARMYPEEDRAQNIRRREFLVDMYLNMPDKGGGDTPLHLATKFGHLEMVRLLCSYHQTRTDTTNKFGEQAAAVVCSRARDPGPDTEREIREILGGQVVIPVYSSCEGKQLGRPISLMEASDLLEARSPEICPTLDTSVASLGSGSPLVQSSRARVSASAPASPLSTSISAVMGPVTTSQAKSLYRTWRTGSEGSEGDRVRERLGDPVLGVERQGRDLASREGVLWTEWWPWLGEYCDLTTQTGLSMLEIHLERRTREARESVDMEYQADIEEFESSIALNHEDEVFSGELELVSRLSSTPVKSSSWTSYRSSSGDDSLNNGDLDKLEQAHNGTDNIANMNMTKAVQEPLSPLSSLMSGFDNMNLAPGSRDSGVGQRQELTSLTTPPTKLHHPLSNEVMRTMEQFVSAAVTLLVDSVPDTDPGCVECWPGDLDWLTPLASHWSVLRRQVNNWRSDPAQRWAGLDWAGVGCTLVEMMGDQVTLELGTGLERERLARMMESVARAEAEEEDSSEQEESYERGRRRRVSARSGTAVRDVTRLCSLVSSLLLSPIKVPDTEECAELWELETGKRCVRTSNVNRARRFLHSGSTSSGESVTAVGESDPAPITQADPGPSVRLQLELDTGSGKRRDSLCSQSSQESPGAWLTPPTSPGASSLASMETCSEGLSVWVQGEAPSVQDRRLAEVLAHVPRDTLAQYPHVSWYLAHVTSFTTEQQRQWLEATGTQGNRPYGGLARKLNLDFTN